MNIDFWRLACLILLSLLIGIVSGQYTIVFVSAFTLFFIWQYSIFKELLLWLRKRKEFNPPSQAGIVDDICREIEQLRNRNKKRKAKLSNYLKRYQDSTAAIPDAVIVLGTYGEIEWANEKAFDYMGIKWPQDAGLRISNLVRHPQLQDYLSSNDEELLKKGLQMESPVRPDLKLEYRINFYGESQRLLVVRDITIIHQITQMRKDFIANASHELRTPLTVISGYLESFSEDKEKCPPEWETQIKQMRKQANRMQNLINDLLMLSTLENKSSNNTASAVPVPELLDNIYQEALSFDTDGEHIIYLETDSSLWIKGDQKDLYSAFSNLIFNAIQYTPKKTVIRVRWFHNADGAHCEVIDNGPGIGGEHVSRLTERFYRVDQGRSREQGGTGLGLAIVKHVIRKHEGDLEITSQLGVGSSFICHFPAKNIVIKQQDEQSLLKAL